MSGMRFRLYRIDSAIQIAQRRALGHGGEGVFAQRSGRAYPGLRT